MRLRPPLVPLLLAMGVGWPAAAAADKERRAIIFFTAEIHGAVEPCGCTSDPLGDVSRYAALVKAAKKQSQVLLVDAGGLSYPAAGVGADKQAAADLRAEML